MLALLGEVRRIDQVRGMRAEAQEILAIGLGYAALGLVCALLMLVYRWFAVSADKASAPPVAPA